MSFCVIDTLVVPPRLYDSALQTKKILCLKCIHMPNLAYWSKNAFYQSKCPHGVKMLNLLLNYVVCGRYLEFMLNNMFKGKLNVRNEIPMAKLGKIDLLFVKIAPQMKNFCSAGTDGGHF